MRTYCSLSSSFLTYSAYLVFPAVLSVTRPPPALITQPHSAAISFLNLIQSYLAFLKLSLLFSLSHPFSAFLIRVQSFSALSTALLSLPQPFSAFRGLTYSALFSLTQTFLALLGLSQPYSALFSLSQPYSAFLSLAQPDSSFLSLTQPYSASLPQPSSALRSLSQPNPALPCHSQPSSALPSLSNPYSLTQPQFRGSTQPYSALPALLSLTKWL